MELSSSIKDIIDLTKQLCCLLKKHIDAYKNVFPAAEETEVKVSHFHDLISPVLKTKHHPIHNHLEHYQATLDTIREKIQTFLDDEERHAKAYEGKSSFKRTINRYNAKRLAHASRLESYFNDASATIDKDITKLKTYLSLGDQFVKCSVLQFYDTMKPEAYDCWKRINNEYHQSTQVSWSHFILSYKIFYKQFNSEEWDDRVLTYMKQIACAGGDNITIGGFSLLVNACDFPLNPAKLPSLLDAPVFVSAQTRSHVVTSINELITFFATEQMRQHCFNVRQWYLESPETGRQERAYEWARGLKVLGTKKRKDWNDYDYQVDSVDMARRTIFYFYHRFAIIIEIDQLSTDLFEKVDFPGKHRLNEFLDYIKPLDLANYVINKKKPASDWDGEPNKVPEVYKSVATYLDSLKKKKEQKEQQNTVTTTAATPMPPSSSSSAEPVPAIYTVAATGTETEQARGSTATPNSSSSNSSGSSSNNSTSINSEFEGSSRTTATTVSSSSDLHLHHHKSLVKPDGEFGTGKAPVLAKTQVDLYAGSNKILNFLFLVFIFTLFGLFKDLVLSPLHSKYMA